MARLNLNALLGELRGKVDNAVIRKIRGQLYFHRKPQPDPKRKPTANQRQHRLKFKLASAWAEEVQQGPELHAFYSAFAAARDLRVRAVAISDYFSTPQVSKIDLRHYRGRAGDSIRVHASDEPYGVVRLVVAIHGGAVFIEDGEATQKGKFWVYIAKTPLPRSQTVTITATAFDRPGQRGELKASWPSAERVEG